MFDLETRKRVTNKLVEYIEEITINITKDRGKAGMLVLFFHMLILIILFFLILWSKSAKLVGIGLIIWITIIFQHLYFGGCWVLKCERKIWNTTEWYGPLTTFYQYISDLGLSGTKKICNTFTFLFTSLTSIIAIVRYKRLNKLIIDN